MNLSKKLCKAITMIAVFCMMISLLPASASAATVKVKSITLSDKRLTMAVGESKTLTAIVSPTNATNKDIKWTSDTMSVATVNSKGEVVALKQGTTKITVASASNNKKSSCTITVKKNIPVKKVALNEKSVTIKVGETISLNAAISPVNATNQKVTWKSGKSKVATVNKNGTVTGVSSGKATITMTANDSNKKAKCTVQVEERIPVEGISFEEGTVIIGKGKKQGLVVKLNPSNATNSNMKFKSSNTTIVKVNKSGVVTGVKTGEATITVTTKDGNKTAACTVVVRADNSIYEKMIALKEQYPEGMPWTNDNYYKWNGGIYSGGYGCAGFAFILSDAAFGTLPARKHTDFNNLRVGDIIRMNNDTHSVIVLNIDNTKITIAEGNFNSSIHWGRQFSIEEMISTSDYILTRYPN